MSLLLIWINLMHPFWRKTYYFLSKNCSAYLRVLCILKMCILYITAKVVRVILKVSSFYSCHLCCTVIKMYGVSYVSCRGQSSHSCLQMSCICSECKLCVRETSAVTSAKHLYSKVCPILSGFLVLKIQNAAAIQTVH